MWDSENALFLEYKDSVDAYKNTQAAHVQKLHDTARNVARAIGFPHYSFKMVVGGLSRRSQKGGCEVIPLVEMESYVPEWENTMAEKDFILRLVRRNREFLRKTGKKGDPEQASYDSDEGEEHRLAHMNSELETLMKMLDQD